MIETVETNLEPSKCVNEVTQLYSELIEGGTSVKMENWSRATSVRYGFSRVDSYGNVVSIWNFGDLEDVLKDVDMREEWPQYGGTAGPMYPNVQDTSSLENFFGVSFGGNGVLLDVLDTLFHAAVEVNGGGELTNTSSEAVDGDQIASEMPPLEQSTSGVADFESSLPHLETDWDRGKDNVNSRQSVELNVGRVALFVAAVWCMVSAKEGLPLSDTGHDLIVHILYHSFAVSHEGSGSDVDVAQT